MLNLICLKHGNKYSSEYVNKLHNMIVRNLTIPHRFICFTDNSNELNSSIEIINLPKIDALQGWWWKPYIFKKGHFSEGDINLFFDLDMVIISNIDKLANYLPSEFVGLEDLSRVFGRSPQKLGSAVMKWPAGQFHDIWDKFENDSSIIKRFRGDQDWIWFLHSKNIKFYPKDWIISYKWEARNINELYRDIDQRLKFKTIRDPIIPKETSVLAFHGTPDPHDVFDPIIVDSWR